MHSFAIWWSSLSWSQSAALLILLLWALVLARIVWKSLGWTQRSIPPRAERRRHRQHWYPRSWPREQHRSYFADCRRVPEDQQ